MSAQPFWSELRTWTQDKLKRDWSSVVLRSLLWGAGPLLSYLFLPIEGEFWNGLMPNGNRLRAYAGCFVLDVVGSVLIYFFGRIQQTARKGDKQWKASWGILYFAGAGVLASWFVSFQQMSTIGRNVYWWVHALNAAIQPVIQLGIGYTQAVLGGKFDPVAVGQSVSKPAPKVNKKRAGAPSIDWWRATYGQLNGEREQMTPGRVRELVLAEWEDVPKRTTLYNWSKECVESEWQIEPLDNVRARLEGE